MTKDEIRARYARVPTDFSQIQMLKNQLLESGILDVAQINVENAGKLISFDENGVLTVSDGASEAETAKFADALNILTEAPTEANVNGLKVVVLNAEPDTKYNGYLYIITEA